MFGIGIPELLIIFIIWLIIVIGVIFIISVMLKSQKSSSAPGNKSDRLKELQKMKDNGLINEDEFNTKRNEILGSL